MTQSKIEWTDRSDWNPIRGCTRVSPGCGGPGPHGGCYAEGIAARFSGPGMAFEGFAKMVNGKPRWTGKVALMEDRLTEPLHWRKPARIFACSMSDLFHENLPDEAIDKVFAVMALCPQHTFQVLTKRPQRMRDYLLARNGMGNAAICNAINSIPAQLGNRHGALEMPLPHVWLGVSVEDQTRADERIPLLLETPAAKRFLSCEPLLGPVTLAEVEHAPGHCIHALWGLKAHTDGTASYGAKIDWVIAGSESGHNARECDLAWVRTLRDQCSASGVPFFWKQHASNGKKIPLPELDGRQWAEFPS